MSINITELTAKILSSRKISRWEHQVMSAMLGMDNLDEQERVLIRRVFYGVRHGLLTTVD